MAKRQIKAGSTSVILGDVFCQDSTRTDGGGLAGLVYNTAGLTCYYHRNTGSASVAVTLATMTLGTWATGGFKLVDDTNMKGVVSFCPPDAALAAGAQAVTFYFQGAANLAPVVLEIELTANDNQDAVRGGMTALPNANAAASGGVPINGVNTGTMTLAALTVSGATTLTGNVALAAGLTITQSTTNGAGIDVTGNGTGAGIKTTGGATGNGMSVTGIGSGHGMYVSGGSSGGHGIYAFASGGNAQGIQALGFGTGAGILSQGGQTGPGVSSVGGSTSGAAATFTNTTGDVVTITGTAGNANALVLAGQGSGAGLKSTGGATGHGFQIIGGGTSGDGINATTTNGNAINAQAFGSSKSGIVGQANTSGSGSHGIFGSGNASGSGMKLAGGSTGNALTLAGGATSGDALNATTTSGHGFNITATGTAKDAIHAVGAAAATTNAGGHGINAIGGAASTSAGGTAGVGFNVAGGAGAASTNGAGEGATFIGGGTTTVAGARGISATGTGNLSGAFFLGAGTGAGIKSTGGATGHALALIGGATSGDGINVTTTLGHGVNLAPAGANMHGFFSTGGNSGVCDGMKLVAGTGGVDFRANRTGNLTGTVDTVTTYTGNTPQTGDNYARLGAPAGASIAADIAAVNAKTTNLPAAPASTTNITGGTITTVTTLTNLPSIPANWLTAAGIAASALNGKGDWLLSSSYTAPLSAAGVRTAVGLASANLDTQFSGVATQTSVNNLNNLSALANLFAPTTLVRPASGSIAYPFTFVVRDVEGHLIDVDTNAVTLTATNTAGTDRSANLSAVTHAGTGEYTFSYTVASSHADEGLRVTAAGTVQSATRKGFANTEVADAEALSSLAAIQAKTDQLTFTGTNVNANTQATAGALTFDLTGSISGSVGSVAGDVGGNLLGSVSGSVSGGIAGSIAGNVVGDVQGKILGGGSSVLSQTAAVTADSPALLVGTAVSGDVNTIQLDSGYNVVDFYKGDVVETTGGTGPDQSRLIIAYDGAAHHATVAPPFITAPDNTTTFRVRRAAPVDVELWNNATPSAALDAAGVRSAVGLASADLDTQLAEIAADTDTLLTGVTVSTNNDKTGYALTAAYDAAKTAAPASTALSTATWTNAKAAFIDVAINSRSTYAGADTGGTTTLLARIPGTVQPQTGDSYAVVNNGTFGNSVLARRTDLPTGFSTLTIASNSVRALDSSGNAIAPAATALSTAQWTNARAGYLDNLNVGGAVASHADVLAINQSASKHLLIQTVAQYERPDSGSTVYTVEVRTFAADTGAAVNADSTPTLTATGQTSGSLTANLSAATNPATGVYRWTYSVASGATNEPVRFDVSATIAAATYTLSAYTQIVDTVSATWTSTDASHLTAVFNKLPANNIADETLVLAAVGSPMQAGSTVVLTDASLTTAKLGAFALAKGTNLTGLNDITAAAIVSGGAITTSGGAIATVTNLTNAPTAGDFTAAMKTSLNAATPVVTVTDKTGFKLASDGLAAVTTWTVAITGNLSGSVGTVTGNVGGNVAGSVASVAAAVTLPANPPAGFLVTASYGTAPAWYTAPGSAPTAAAIDAQLSGTHGGGAWDAAGGGANPTAIFQDLTSTTDFTTPGSIGQLLVTALGRIGTGQIVVADTRNGATADLTVTKGSDNFAADGHAIDFLEPSPAFWPASLAPGVQVTLYVGHASLAVAGTVLAANGQGLRTVRFEPTAAATSILPIGTTGYVVWAALATGHQVPLAQGRCYVLDWQKAVT